MKQLTVYSPGQTVLIGSEDEKFHAKIVCVCIKQSGIVYEVVYWKEKHRVVELLEECEINTVGKTKEKTKLGFHTD